MPPDVQALSPYAYQKAFSLPLAEKAERFSNRMLAIMAAVAICALMVVVLGVWVALAWQRSEVASLVQEKADLRGEIAAMTEVSQKMQSQGLKIEFQDCKEANGHMRRCVAVQPGMSFFGTAQAPFYVLKGY